MVTTLEANHMYRLLAISLLLCGFLSGQTFKSKVPISLPQGGFSGNIYPNKAGFSYLGNSNYPYTYGYIDKLTADSLFAFSTIGFSNKYYPTLNISIVDGFNTILPGKTAAGTFVGQSYRPFRYGYIDTLYSSRLYADDSEGNRVNVITYLDSIGQAANDSVMEVTNFTDTSNTIYLMSTFNDAAASNGDNMYLYVSTDGKNFTHLYGDIAFDPADFDTAAGTILRDPSIIRYGNYYYVAYTSDWANDTLGIARSADLVHWVHWWDIPTNATSKLWAPEFFVEDDGTVYIAGSHYNNSPRMKFYTAADSTLQNWSGPTDFSATDAGITGSINDIFIIKVGSTYHALYSKNALQLEHSTASAYDGPYTIQDTIFNAENNEGPAVWKIGSTYRIAFFVNSNGRYWYVDTDNWSSYTSPALLNADFRWGHCTVTTVNDARGYMTILSGLINGKASTRTAIGAFNLVNQDTTITIGNNNYNDTKRSIAIGLHNYNSNTTGESITIGQRNTNTGNDALSIGKDIVNSASNTVLLGEGVTAASDCYNSVAIGGFSSLDSNNTVAIGQNASASHIQSTALGFNSATTKSHQVRLGATNDTISVPNMIEFDNITPPAVDPTAAWMFAQGGELKVEDAAGNITTISPHNFSAIPGGPSEPEAWAFYSENDSTIINVDMMKAIRLLEQISGQKLIFVKRKTH